MSEQLTENAEVICQRIRLSGVVQGVGFRPFVLRLAKELQLTGWVRNDGAGVMLAVDGQKVPEFITRLPREAPRLARIDAIEAESAKVAEVAGDGFVILDSVAGDITTAIGPDAAICPDCVADLCDPAGRRWRYAFTNCAHCGPRYTLIKALPYDRVRTSMAAFPLCPACRAEYENPLDRRFHAEPIACPVCGPEVWLIEEANQLKRGSAPAPRQRG